jgi:hypothetical protein
MAASKEDTNPKPLGNTAPETFVESRFGEWDPEEALSLENAGTGWTGLVAAPTKAGKTHLTTYLLSKIGHWFDEIVLVSPTRSISGDFPCFNDKNVMQEFDLVKVQAKFDEWKRINKRFKGDKRRMKRFMFIFDDIISHAPDIHSSQTLMEIATLGRHHGVSQILLLQSLTKSIVPPAFRDNVEFLIVSFLKQAQSRKLIFEIYMGIVDRKEAERVYNALTRRKFGFVVLQHNPHARELEEVIFRYTVPANLGQFRLRPRCVELQGGGAIPAPGSCDNYLKRPPARRRTVETGFLYVMSSPVLSEAYGDLYKVGRTSNLAQRMRAYRTGLPGASELWSALFQDIAEIEQRVLERLYPYNWKLIRDRRGLRQIEGAKEWFLIPFDELQRLIDEVQAEVARDRQFKQSVVRTTRQGTVRRHVDEAATLEGSEEQLARERVIRRSCREKATQKKVNRQVLAMLKKRGLR